MCDTVRYQIGVVRYQCDTVIEVSHMDEDARGTFYQVVSAACLSGSLYLGMTAHPVWAAVTMFFGVFYFMGTLVWAMAALR